LRDRRFADIQAETLSMHLGMSDVKREVEDRKRDELSVIGIEMMFDR